MKLRPLVRTLFISLSLSLAGPAALAHVTLEQGTAVSGSRYKAVFRVPHGCDGSATRAVTVFLPPGVLGSKPKPKAGWHIQITTEPVPPYVSEGNTITERPAVVSWRGLPLPDAFYDEYVMIMQLPPSVGPLYFRVLQECIRGSTDWAVIPTSGQPNPPNPAVRLNLTSGN